MPPAMSVSINVMPASEFRIFLLSADFPSFINLNLVLIPTQGEASLD
jgi:hypothetical protein